MSLVSNEGDSEQNEIRNLQEKLESTMGLVRQLSGQLAELKEQVSKLARGKGTGPGGWVGGGSSQGTQNLQERNQQAGTPP